MAACAVQNQCVADHHSLDSASSEASELQSRSIDSVLGARTATAIETYQEERGRPVSNLTLKTLA